MGSIGSMMNMNTRSIQNITSENPKLNNVLDKAFRKANLIGEDADLYQVIYSYKAFRELPQNDVEIIYDYLVERLGF